MIKTVEISTTELVELIERKDVKIIDVRPIDAYNGWKLGNEIMGGHIKGAKTLPTKWANYMDWIEIVKTKDILPEQKIVIYGYNNEQSEKVAKSFENAGYGDISLYNHFVDEWAANDVFPMEKLERYGHLVYPEWVKTILNGEPHPSTMAIKQ